MFVVNMRLCLLLTYSKARALSTDVEEVYEEVAVKLQASLGCAVEVLVDVQNYWILGISF